MQQVTQQLIVGNKYLIKYVLISNRPWFFAKDFLLGFNGEYNSGGSSSDEMLNKVKNYNRITNNNVTIVNAKGLLKLIINNDDGGINTIEKNKIIDDIKRFCLELENIADYEKECDTKMIKDLECKIQCLETRLNTEMRSGNEKNEIIKQLGLEIDILSVNNEILENENKTIEIKNKEIKQLQIEIQIGREEMEELHETLNRIREENNFENEFKEHELNKLKRKNNEKFEKAKKKYEQKLTAIKNICMENITDM